MAWIKLYETYNKVKKVFIKPKLYFKFGLWRNDHCLPVWRHGPIINLFPKKFIYKNSYQVRSGCSITTYRKGDKMKNGEIAKWDYGDTSYHKLPGNLNSWDRVWNRDFRKKLKKWHLNWIKPYYQLPIWLSFYIFNHDFGWKTKWTSYDFRYEYSPQFTIVIFGLSFSWWLKCPGNDAANDNFYWEGILYYLYGEKPLDLKYAINGVGKWTTVNTDQRYSYWGLNKCFIKPEYWNEYDKSLMELEAQINKKKKDET